MLGQHDIYRSFFFWQDLQSKHASMLTSFHTCCFREVVGLDEYCNQLP